MLLALARAIALGGGYGLPWGNVLLLGTGCTATFLTVVRMSLRAVSIVAMRIFLNMLTLYHFVNTAALYSIRLFHNIGFFTLLALLQAKIIGKSYSGTGWWNELLFFYDYT